MVERWYITFWTQYESPFIHLHECPCGYLHIVILISGVMQHWIFRFDDVNISMLVETTRMDDVGVLQLSFQSLNISVSSHS